MATILHTSDWHVGKLIRGNSRADEHTAVLGEIVDNVEEHSVDLVLVAGDLFETAAPSPDAEATVYRALLDMTARGAEVAVIAGNHDNAHRLRAIGPLLEIGHIHLASEVQHPDSGGVRSIELRSGEQVSLAMLPFVSQRGIVRAEALMQDAAFQHAQAYADRLRRLIDLLCSALASDLPSVLLVHGFVLGAKTGGGERAAHLVDEYAITAQSFPGTIGYVALGHLHRAQKLPGASPIHYCGSPLQLDFGETTEAKQVNLVELLAGRAAKVKPIELASGSKLVTVRGTVEEIVDRTSDVDESSWIRARVTEPQRAGLADELRDRLGPLGSRLVDVMIEADANAVTARPPSRRDGRPPRELFTDYLNERGIDDSRLVSRFDDLHAEVLESEDSS